jgi:hypothetical protein
MLIHEYLSNNPSSSGGRSRNGDVISTAPISAPGDDIAMERGGLLRTYACDVHMDSLANVWNPSSTTAQNFFELDPSVSSFEEENFSPVHLIILQHGFQGTGFDMRLIRNALHMEFPQYLVPLFLHPSTTLLLLTD